MQYDRSCSNSVQDTTATTPVTSGSHSGGKEADKTMEKKEEKFHSPMHQSFVRASPVEANNFVHADIDAEPKLHDSVNGTPKIGNF